MSCDCDRDLGTTGVPRRPLSKRGVGFGAVTVLCLYGLTQRFGVTDAGVGGGAPQRCANGLLGRVWCIHHGVQTVAGELEGTKLLGGSEAIGT